MEVKKYKALILKKFGGDLALGEREMRPLEKDQILVKVMCGTIHPADLAFLSGTYGHIKPELFPIVPGLEGSGEIVEAGPGVDSSYVGKRANVFALPKEGASFDGVWAEYFIATLNRDCVVYDEKIPYEKLCFALGNPLTAMGFLDTVRKSKTKAVVQTGASSAFGKMFLKLCLAEGVEIINVVRRDAHFKTFQQYGAKHMISTNDPNWYKDLEKLAKELQATVIFDCVGGDLTGQFLSAMPEGSTLYHFGNLELKRLGEIDPMEFINKGKNMKGWWLTEWMRNLTPEELKKNIDYTKKDLLSNTPILGTDYSKSFKLEEVEKAFEQYLTDMSGGKIIFKPNDN